MEFDALISGAGPVGLCMAQALAGAGLRLGVIEPQAEAALADPAFDGREIALTQKSAEMLRRLGLWARIEADAPAAFSPLRDAQVFNGATRRALTIGHALTAHGELGWLVSNHHIRRAAWAAVQASIARHGDITLITGDAVARPQLDAGQAQVTLASGAVHTARLLLAADSRFSPTRRAAGIGASQHDFGRTMLVCEMTHDVPHHHVAWEWFGHGQTLALLPMNGDTATGEHRASVVLTLPHPQIEAMLALDAPAFGADLTRRFEQRLGAMRLASTRHIYPLVGVYPDRLVAQRLACVGDAAVGMHPVTAHGFNFGLLGVDTLAHELLAAHRRGQDIGAPDVLARYQRRHRLATRPLYEITRAIATLYTRDSRPARLLRDAALQLADRLPPFKRAVAASLAS